MAEAGHVFLARMGKTTPRSGGIDATAWLIEQADIKPETKILEVACNMGRTMIQLCERFGCKITGVDLDENALSQARKNIEKRHLEDKLTLVHGDAMALPFEDNSFDIIINEAMLLTHDVMLFTDDSKTQRELRIGLSRAINVNVEPFNVKGWREVLEDHGYGVSQKYGKMTLMNPKGMIHDEGFLQTLRIVRNAMKNENKPMFKKMFSYFNGHKDLLGYICNVSIKPQVSE